MGVSGCGKSSVAQALAHEIGGEYLDADPYHPPANVEKMSRGIPLTDEDRWGWLDVLAGLLRERASGSMVLACSALKEAYRQRLRVSPEVRFVYLKGSFELIQSRLENRTGHFFNAALLRSQFDALQEPTDAIIVDAAKSVDEQVDEIVRAVCA